MEYGKLFNRAASVVWQNKFLIALGFLASLGSGSFPSGGGGGGGGASNGGTGDPFAGINEEFAGLAIGAIIAVACVIILLALALWVVSTIARGGLIAGVDDIESGAKSSFGQAWSAGWQRVWTLLGIGFLPAIPGLILFVGGILALGAFGGMSAIVGQEFAEVMGAPIGITAALLTCCIVLPIILVLSILRNFAERAAMLEGLGVIDSYRRGASVLSANLGEAIILFVLQLALFIGLGILLFVPGFLIALCCLLWPLLLVVQGAITGFTSALWTLAWRQWTGEPPLVEKMPAAV